MTPQDFTFKLTVPNDPDGATVVAVVAAHAVEYASIEGAAGAGVRRARARRRAGRPLKAAPPATMPGRVRRRRRPADRHDRRRVGFSTPAGLIADASL